MVVSLRLRREQIGYQSGGAICQEALFGVEFLRRLGKLRLRARCRHISQFTGSRASQRRGFGLDFCDFREYVPGDDPRQLDWALFGRTDRLFVKIFEEEGDVTLHVLIDFSRSMRCGDPLDSKPDALNSKMGRALRCAASVAYIALGGLARVQVHLFDSSIFCSSRLLRGPSAFAQLLEFLSLKVKRKQVGSERTDLSAVARDFCNRQAGTGICLLVSDLLDPSWQRALSILLQRRHELYLLQICGADELCNFEPGMVELVDVETGQSRLLLLDSITMEEQRRRMIAFRDEVATFCAANKIGCSRLYPGEPFEEVAFRTLLESGLVRMR